MEVTATAPVFTGASSAFQSSLLDPLPPFPMWPAFPASEYYGGSAPSRPIGRQRAHPPARWRRRHRKVPVFTVIRSTGEAPGFAPAARRGYAADLHHDLPGPAHHRPDSSPQPGRRLLPDPEVRTALQPISTGFELVDDEEALQHRFLAYAFPSRSPDPAHPVVLARPDFVAAAPTSPAFPGSGCRQLHPACCDSEATKVSHPHPKQQRLTAHNMLIDSRDLTPARRAGRWCGPSLRLDPASHAVCQSTPRRRASAETVVSS